MVRRKSVRWQRAQPNSTEAATRLTHPRTKVRTSEVSHTTPLPAHSPPQIPLCFAEPTELKIHIICTSLILLRKDYSSTTPK